MENLKEIWKKCFHLIRKFNIFLLILQKKKIVLERKLNACEMTWSSLVLVIIWTDDTPQPQITSC